MSRWCGECGGRGELSGSVDEANVVTCDRCNGCGLAPVSATIYHRSEGGHVQCRVFVGRSDDGGSRGKAGDLTIRAEEWDEFRSLCSSLEFEEQE